MRILEELHKPKYSEGKTLLCPGTSNPRKHCIHNLHVCTVYFVDLLYFVGKI